MNLFVLRSPLSPKQLVNSDEIQNLPFQYPNPVETIRSKSHNRGNQEYSLRDWKGREETCGIHVWNHTSDEKEYSIKEEQSRLISARS